MRIESFNNKFNNKPKEKKEGVVRDIKNVVEDTKNIVKDVGGVIEDVEKVKKDFSLKGAIDIAKKTFKKGVGVAAAISALSSSHIEATTTDFQQDDSENDKIENLEENVNGMPAFREFENNEKQDIKTSETINTLETKGVKTETDTEVFENQEIVVLEKDIKEILRKKIRLGSEEEYNKLSVGLMGHISRLSGITGIYNPEEPNKSTGYSVEAGPGISANFEYAPNKFLSFRGSIGSRELGVHYNENGINLAKMKMAELDAIFRLLPNEEVRPYVFAGGGADIVKSNNPISSQLRETAVGGHFNLGGGIEANLGKIDGLGNIVGKAEVAYRTSTGNKWDGNLNYNEAKGLFHDNGDSFYDFGAGISIALETGGGKSKTIEIPLETRREILTAIRDTKEKLDTETMTKITEKYKPDIIVIEIPKEKTPSDNNLVMNLNRIETKNMEGIGGSIYFDFDEKEYDFKDPNKPAPVALIKNIEYIAGQMKTEYKDSEVTLTGHADSRGTEEYNLKLSGDRAETVKRELVRKGINPDRIIIKALGEDPSFLEKPDAVNERDHAYNRFVSFTLMKEKNNKNNEQKIPQESVEKKEKITTPEQVINLMKGSKSSEEWDKNCDKVKEAFGGVYPDFWFEDIMKSGVYDAIQNSWEK